MEKRYYLNDGLETFEARLSGNELSSHLLVLVSGMFYNFFMPPSDAILGRIRKRLEYASLLLETEQCAASRVRLKNFTELSVERQVKRIEKSIQQVVSQYGNVERISFLSQSVGSIVLHSLLEQCSSNLFSHRVTPDNCILVVPATVVTMSIPDPTQGVDTGYFPLKKLYPDGTALYGSRQGGTVTIPPLVWQNLASASERYTQNIDVFGAFMRREKLTCFFSSRDGAFPDAPSSFEAVYPSASFELVRGESHAVTKKPAAEYILSALEKKLSLS